MNIFQVGDKIEARRNNGNVIQAEIDSLFDEKASVSWCEGGVWLTRKFYYRQMLKVNVVQNNQQLINRNSFELTQREKRTNNCLRITQIIAFFLLGIILFLIFITGVFETYQRSAMVIF